MCLLDDVRLIESIILPRPLSAHLPIDGSELSTSAQLINQERYRTMLFYFTEALLEAITDKRARVKFSYSMVVASMSISLLTSRLKPGSCIALPLDLRISHGQKTNASHAQCAEYLDLT